MNKKIERIKKVLTEKVGYGDEDVCDIDEYTSIDDFHFDSMDEATFIVGCEDEFGISIPDVEWGALRHSQIKDILAFIPD